MALPSTGSISMSQVRTELGLSGSISLGQSQVRELAGRPTGSISMSHLRGKSAVNWDGKLSDLNPAYSESGGGFNQAIVEIHFVSNGDIRLRGNYPFRDNVIGKWNGTHAHNSNTEIRFVVTAGGVTTNGATSFSPMTSLRVIGLFAYNQTQTATVRIELRMNGNSSTMISHTVSLTAQHFYDDGGGEGPIM